MDTTAASATSSSTTITITDCGDPDARIAAIYALHYQRLVGLASLLAGSYAVGEDIAQETFVIALRKERRKQGYLTHPEWPWLRITAVRLAGRLRQRLLRELLDSLTQRNDTAVSPEWGIEAFDLTRALRQLPYRMRLCLVLAHLEDQSTSAIANMLGCSSKNVEHRLHEGRQRLRTILGEGYTTT
ncbi:MAG TPA: RNA polymerase sigma factor [Candidatus Nitrosotalea sp.]|nr:RNA polymerase sigma factor [Candidatus Nitrosotalea sp.]